MLKNYMNKSQKAVNINVKVNGERQFYTLQAGETKELPVEAGRNPNLELVNKKKEVKQDLPSSKDEGQTFKKEVTKIKPKPTPVEEISPKLKEKLNKAVEVNPKEE